MYVGKDIIPKIAVDKAARGVFVANNIFYFENDPVMVLGDQYKPDVGGGSQIKNVFFENNIFKKNHWPKEVLIQPTNNIYHPDVVKVDDIIEARDHLKSKGARVLGADEPKIGAHGKPVLFLHPKDFTGTLLELEQA